MLLHELRHVEADEGLLAAEKELSQGAGHFGFADAGRAKEEEAADGAQRALEACTGTADSPGESGDRLLLRDDALVQFFFDAEKLLRLLFLDRGDGDAGPAADYVFDVFAADDASGGVIEVVLLAQGCAGFRAPCALRPSRNEPSRTRGWRWRSPCGER